MADSQERFQALIENSSDALSLINTEGRVLYANPSTATVLGYPPEELLGQNGFDLLHPQDREHCVQTLQRVLAEPRRADQMQVRVRQKDGQWRWVESTASNLLHEPHIGAIVLNHREISARRAEEEERQRLSEELIRSNAELQAYAHTVAHDLREPLRTISTFTEILLRRAQLEKEDREVADFIVDGVRRMSSLLDSLLSTATCGHKYLIEAVNLGHTARQAMENMKATITSGGATIRLAQLPTVQGNALDLVRVFQNLIGNAVKYRNETSVEVDITAERLGPDWVVRIHDNGIGIPKAHHRKVFGLFARVYGGAVPGTGIGLAVCRQIIEALGGAIWVESEPGAGSTFCFTIAAADRE